MQSRTKLQERRRPSDLLEVVRLNGRAFQFLYKDEGFGSDMSLPQRKDHWLQVRIMHEQGSMAHFLPACLLAMCCAEFFSCRAVCLPLQGCTTSVMASPEASRAHQEVFMLPEEDAGREV